MDAWTLLWLAIVAASLAGQHFYWRRRLQAAQASAATSVQRDPLTGLESRHGLEKHLTEACEPGIVAVLDLDDFRRRNEELGHLGGDEILRAIGRLLQASIRPEDRAFRWGGDEFVLLFSGMEADVARARMASIEARLRHFTIRNYGTVSIGVSWGIATTVGRVLRESLDEADRAMFVSKRNHAQG